MNVEDYGYWIRFCSEDMKPIPLTNLNPNDFKKKYVESRRLYDLTLNGKGVSFKALPKEYQMARLKGLKEMIVEDCYRIPSQFWYTYFSKNLPEEVKKLINTKGNYIDIIEEYGTIVYLAYNDTYKLLIVEAGGTIIWSEKEIE